MKYYENFLKDYLDVDLLSELRTIKEWKDFKESDVSEAKYASLMKGFNSENLFFQNYCKELGWIK